MWIRVTAFLLLGLMTCAMCLGADAPNLLADSGFEGATSGDYLPAWSPNTTYPFETVQVIRSDPNLVRSGSNSVKLVQTKKDAQGQRLFGAYFTAQAIPVEPLVDYTWSFWVRGEGEVDGAIYCYSDTGNVYEPAIIRLVKEKEQTPGAYTVQAGGGWQECRYTFALTSDQTKTKAVRAVIRAHGTVHVDDASFTRKGPMAAVKEPAKQIAQAPAVAKNAVAGNLLKDAGFEGAASGDYLPAWQPNTTYPFETVQVIRSDPNLVRSGSNSVKLAQTQTTAQGEKFGAYFTTDAIPVEPLVEYSLSFWGRGEGQVDGAVYCYNEAGNVYEPAITRLVKEKEQTPGTYKLEAGGGWQECRYTFTLTSDQTKTKTVRVVIKAHGTVYVDDAAFVRKGAYTPSAKTEAAAAPTTAAPAKPSIATRANLLSIHRAAAAPRIDGRIESGEYPTRAEGIVECIDQALYPRPNEWHLAYDPEKLYFAFSFQLPAGRTLSPAGSGRDDAALIAAADGFFCFLRPDADVTKKVFEGAYLSVSSNGIFYDAWEHIDHNRLQCNRDAAFNARWEIVTAQKDGRWTVELAVPWEDLKMPAPEPGKTFALSFGLNVNNQRLAWQSHPTWFDYPQAFGLVRLAGEALSIQAPSLAGLNRGELDPSFRLANRSPAAVPYDLTYVVSTVRMTEGAIGSWVLDVAGDIRQGEALANESLFHRRQTGTLAAGETEQQHGASRLIKPGYYVLEMEAKAAGKTCFYQKTPFHYFPPIVATLAPVPSKNQILAHLSLHGAAAAEGSRLEMVFEDSNGRAALTQPIPNPREEMEVAISMASLPAGDYQVKTSLIGADGQTVADHRQAFRKWETPAWLTERKGIEALDGDWVPYPWTPLTVENGRIDVWGRSFQFGSGSLLASMTSQARPLLAAPGISVKYDSRGATREIEIAAPAVASRQRGRAVMSQQGNSPQFTLSSKAQVEFDGLIRYDVTISPRQPGAAVEKLWISIPFEQMVYANFTDGMRWQTGLIDAQDLSQPGRWYQFWIGNDKVGCSFFVENHKGWLINSAKPRVVLQSQGNRRDLQLLIVNEPSPVSAPLSFTFVLHPTPVKPAFKNWRDIRADGLGYGKPPINLSMIHAWAWNSSDSKPVPRNWQAFGDLIAYLKGRGQRVYPYLGTYYITPYHFIRQETPMQREGEVAPANMLVKSKKDAARVEEYFYFKKDWDLSPPVIHKVGMETQEEVRLAAGTSYDDYFCHGLAEMLTRSEVDGLYCDIPAPSMDFNPERGLAYKTKDGVTEGTYALLTTRDLYKRMYWLFEKHRGQERKPYILGHGMPYFGGLISFWDIVFHGEELKPQQPFGCTKMFLQKSGTASPLAVPDTTDANRTYDAFYYRSFFVDHGGVPMLLLPQYGYRVELGVRPELSRELLSFTFVHNTLLWPAYIAQQPVLDFWRKVEAPFGMGDTTFFPYWENGVRSQPECVKVSYWKKDGREEYLVGIANWSDKTVDATVELPAELAKFATAVEMETGKTAQTGKPWQVSVPAHDLRVFRFGGQ